MTIEDQCIMKHKCKYAGVESKCQEFCPLHVMIHGRLNDSGIQRDYRFFTIDRNPARAVQPDAFFLIDRWAKVSFPRMMNPDKERIKPLYLYSDQPGTGKTSTACAIANSFTLYHVMTEEKPIMNPVFFLDFNNWQMKFNEFNNPNVPKEFKEPASKIFYQARERAKKASLLVIDDIGIRDPSDSFGQISYDLINYRVVNRMPTVFTSNVPMKELLTRYDKRIWDRIRDQNTQIHFVGPSHRGVRKDFD